MFVSGFVKEKEGAIKNMLMTDVNKPQLLSHRMTRGKYVENKNISATNLNVLCGHIQDRPK